MNKEYIKTGKDCTRCLGGQAFWQWEPLFTTTKIPPFKTIKVLKCFQCNYILEWDKESLKRKIYSRFY